MEKDLYKESWDVNARLAELGLTRDILVQTVRACVVGRSSCDDDDPPSARGYETWKYGVNRLRKQLQQEGWFKDDTDQFSTIANDKRRIKIAVCNTDDGTAAEDRSPRNRSRKGVLTERAAYRNAQPYLFDISVEGKVDRRDYNTWYLCVYVTNESVRAELSFPDSFESGYLKSYSERIFIISGDDWNNLDFAKQDSGDGEPNLDINISRK